MLLCSTPLLYHFKTEDIPFNKIEISDHLFSQLFNMENLVELEFCENYGERDLITSYSRFEILVYGLWRNLQVSLMTGILSENVKYLATKAIPRHEDYFIRSLQNDPNKWASCGGIFDYYISDYMETMAMNYLNKSEEVVDFAIRRSCKDYSDLNLSFIPYMVHHDMLIFRFEPRECNDIEGETALYSATMCNRYDKIYFGCCFIRNKLDNKYKPIIINTLLREHKIIKHAKNYLPNGCLVKSWKLSFMRMFEYHNNLTMISVMNGA